MNQILTDVLLRIVEIGVIIAGVYLSLYVSYSLFLVFANLIIREKIKPVSSLKTRFAVIIPAHNEEILLPRLLTSLDQVDYPQYLYKVFVIADNCTDDTCKVVESFLAVVMERRDTRKAGKGYAIKYALENIDFSHFDAIFIVDADSIVETFSLRNLDLAIQSGARVIQCYNGVANPNDSWFTRLMDVSRTISNHLLEPAKEALGFSSHLMGNGMCFTQDVISKYGWDAFTVGEDWEYYAKIVSRGERVAFAKDVQVYHQESVALRQATPQRMRWSSGRLAIAYKYGPSLLFRGLLELDIRKMDASLPLIFPNPSMGVNLNIIFLLIAIPLTYVSLVYWLIVTLFLQICIFCIGIVYTKNRFQKFLAMFMAPTFLAWKMIIDFLSTIGLGRKRWVRTKRQSTVPK